MNLKDSPELANAIYQNSLPVKAMVYGEMRNKGNKHMNMAFSSLVNRIGTNEWKDMTVPEILEEGYYAVKDTSKNKGYEWAMSGKFPSKKEEDAYKKVSAYIDRAIAGDVELSNIQFYFTPTELKEQIKSGDIDINMLNQETNVGNFKTFRYKDKTDEKMSFNEAFSKAKKAGKKTFYWGGKKIAVK